VKPFIHFLSAVCCFSLVLSVSCKKDKTEASKTTCASSVHGFTLPLTTPASYSGSCTHGIINPSAPSITSSGSFPGTVVFSQKAAFNTTDHSYYAFGGATIATTLYKMDAAGAVTAFAPPDTIWNSGLVYNNVANKLYCIRGGKLAEITLGASSFSATPVLTPLHTFITSFAGPASITVDRSSGDMYFSTKDATNFYVEKYHPGAASSSIAASGTIAYPGWSDFFAISDLCFNNSDHMLYGLRYKDSTSFYFVKVDPSAGTVTNVADIGHIVNPDFHIAALDACTNTYILSTRSTGSSGLTCDIYQLNMSGTIVDHTTPASFYQGLDVEY